MTLMTPSRIIQYLENNTMLFVRRALVLQLPKLVIAT